MPTKQQRECAADLVERSRVGDQNAMAILRDMRKNALGGNETAQAGFAAAKEYIEANPVDGAEGGPVVFESEAQIFSGDVQKNVDRVLAEARKGETWAVNLLASIRVRARKGFARAKLLWSIFKNSLALSSKFGGESKALPSGITVDVSYPTSFARLLPCGESGMACIVACFIHGPWLTDERLTDLSHAFANHEESDRFAWGVTNPWDETVFVWDAPPKTKACALLGQCVGRARGAQIVASGRGPVSAFHPDVGWEMGEGLS